MLKIRAEQLQILKQLAHENDCAFIASVPTRTVGVQQSHRLRDEQVQSITDARFISRVKQMLKELFPECPPDDVPQFTTTVHTVVAKARRYAILEDTQVARYICLAYFLGNDFDTRYSAAQSLLQDRSRPADERLSLLEYWLEKMVEASSVGA